MALVTGFAGNVMQLDQAARDLAGMGRDVVVYDYPPDVLLSGDGEQLPRLIDDLSEDFQERAAGHEKLRLGGVSLGGAVAAGMQKQCTDPEPGLYAATGTNPAELVLKHELFGAIVRKVHGVDIRRAFSTKGYTLDVLQESWRDINRPPDTGFSITLGAMDYIIPYHRIKSRIANWRQTNPEIRTHYLWRQGHGGTIKWFNAHCAELLSRSHNN